MNRQFILVTPVKNEAENLPNTIESVVLQTFQPALWVIVDDGSSDDTPLIIQNAEIEHPWIKSIKLVESERDLGLHLADVAKKGVEYALNYCIDNNINYEYIGNLDGDLTLECDFFEKLIMMFENNSDFGVLSGETQFMQNGKIIKEMVNMNEPSGGHMLIKRHCFEDCGGIIVSYSWDSVFKAKARLRGWNTKRVESAIATEARPPSSSDGYWNGYVFHGKSAHYRNLHPFHVLAKSLLLILKSPHYLGIAYMYGYLFNYIKRSDQILDAELRDYYYSKLYNHFKLKG